MPWIGFVKSINIMSFYVRLLKEQEQLNEKIDGLKLFLESDRVSEVDKNQFLLLKVQLPVMISYREVLQERIKLLDS